jgi:hypothetical protein
MEKENQGLPSESSQMAAEEQNITPAQLHAFVAGVLQLVSEGGRGKVRLTRHNRQSTQPVSRANGEQTPPLSGNGGALPRAWHPAKTTTGAAEDAQASVEQSREQAAEKVEPEPDHRYPSGETTEPEVVVGLPAHCAGGQVEVQGAFVHREFPWPQRLQSLWRHGTGR